MYLCVRVRVCVWGRRSWEKSTGKRKKSEEEKTINLFIQINRQTDGRTDRQTDRHKSFIDMRYYTEQCSKSNPIELNQIKSIWNKVEYNIIESNGEQISRRD